MKNIIIVLMLLSTTAIAQKIYKNVNPIDGHIWYETTWIRIEQNAKPIGVRHVNLHFVNRGGVYYAELIIKSSGRNTYEIHNDNVLAIAADSPIILKLSGFNTDIVRNGANTVIKPVYLISESQLRQLMRAHISSVKIQFAKKIVDIDISTMQSDDISNIASVIYTGHKTNGIAADTVTQKR